MITIPVNALTAPSPNALNVTQQQATNILAGGNVAGIAAGVFVDHSNRWRGAFVGSFVGSLVALAALRLG